MNKKIPSNSLVTINKERVATQLRELAEQVESGAISCYELKQTDSSVTFTVDSANGQERMINHQDHIPGLRREQLEHIQKQSPQQRRELVKTLVAENMPQTEIAKRTMTSQKTISNDIRRLKNDGVL
jgi:DNA-directed RNA polymerase specialized sigma24 family protein